MKRSEVPVEQTWDMSTVFAGLDEWEASFADLSEKKDQV
ncbi:MAG: oligoendopeptidase F family protein, partial [Clostridiaceae bacterium]|nr:oligoendopeptidase F family protein [Clostridiaceae bacterium]